MQCDVIVEKLFHPVIANDEGEARQVVQEALAAGVNEDALSRDAFLPLLRTINALHRGGQLTGLSHHYAIQLLHALLHESQSRTRPNVTIPRTGQAVVQPRRVVEPHHRRRRSTAIIEAPPLDDSDEEQSSGPVDQYVSIWISDGVLIARPIGPRISEREAPIIATEISDAMDYLGGRLRRFVLDLTDVQTMSSMALGLCIDVQQRARRAGARAVMYGVNTHLAEGLRAMKVDRLYEQARDERELKKLIAA